MTDNRLIDLEKLTETQQRMIDAALELISHVGYKSTTTKKIAELAEVNETTIFKNFHSKQQLIDTAYQQHTKEITKEVDHFFAQNFSTVEELLRKAGHFIAEIFYEHRSVILGAVKEVGNENMKFMFSYKQEYIKQSLCLKLKETAKENELTSEEYEALAYVFTNTILNLLLDNFRNEYVEEFTHTVDLDSILSLLLKIV